MQLRDVYFMCGVSDRINEELKKIIDDKNKKRIIIFVSQLILIFLLKLIIIKKIPEIAINSKAFVALVPPSLKGAGYSSPNK